MTIGTMEKLEIVLENLSSKFDGCLTSCVVTNERGLIIHGVEQEDTPNETLAAMVSLFSDAALRVSTNLGIDNPSITSIMAPDVTVAIREFSVRNQRFRIGAMISVDKVSRFSLRRRKTALNSINNLLRKAAMDIRQILEHT